MGLLDEIQKTKRRLKSVEVTVTLPDGSEINERKNVDGTFEKVSIRENDRTEVIQENSKSTMSKRMLKKMERAKKFGFIIDEKPDLEMASVTEGVYLGSQDVAADFKILKDAGITHIVNCATGVREFYPKNFKYLTIEVLDLPETRLTEYFHEVHEFMTNCVGDGGRVFVHCNAGISRSSTLVISYLMKVERMKFEDAFRKVKEARPVIRPNDGFMKQLREYEDFLVIEKK